MRPLLHRARGADWDKLRPAERNAWQRFAAGSHGLATPANFISLAGGALALYGLWLITKGSASGGLALVFVGRLADLLDGIVADKTKTKSGFGETLDATVDKIVIFTALLVLGSRDLVPPLIYYAVLAQSLYNSLLALLAKALKAELHPSLAGKSAAALAWFVIIAYALAGQLKSHSLKEALTWLAALAFGLFVIAGLASSYNYSSRIYNLAKDEA